MATCKIWEILGEDLHDLLVGKYGSTLSIDMLRDVLKNHHMTGEFDELNHVLKETQVYRHN